VWTSPRKHGRAPLPVGNSPALAKGAASVELTGRAKKGTAAELEALEFMACGEAGRKRDVPARRCRASSRHAATIGRAKGSMRCLQNVGAN
jgi:hypothetical protein